MNQLLIGDLTVDIVRKSIKNLHLGVYPPDGRVRVATPLSVTDDSVRLFVIAKMPWIRRQQSKFADQARQTDRIYVRRESHYVWGQRYLLNTIDHMASPRIELRGTRLDLYARPNLGEAGRRRVLTAWYREQLKDRLPDLLSKWEPIMGVTVTEWGVKQMKTKWGTCNVDAGRIWLNLELAKKPLPCLEYVVVHEMTHLLERNHTPRFRALLDEFIPNWRTVREELNTFIL